MASATVIAMPPEPTDASQSPHTLAVLYWFLGSQRECPRSTARPLAGLSRLSTSPAPMGVLGRRGSPPSLRGPSRSPPREGSEGQAQKPPQDRRASHASCLLKPRGRGSASPQRRSLDVQRDRSGYR